MTTTKTRTYSAPETATTRFRWGATLWIAGVAQYFIAQVVVGSRWKSAYSWTGNYISDLGNSRCGQFAVPHGQPGYVCSPDHVVMNASFIVAGLLSGAGILMLRRLWPARRSVTVGVVLLYAAACGKIVVGLVPENTNIGLHTIGALNIPLGSVAILLLSLSVWQRAKPLAAVGVVLACVGLVGSGVSVAGQYAGHSAYLGLGVGGAERLAAYPGNLWMLVIGLVVLARTSVFDAVV
jgi:hypothetical membrane protein